jgi:hypothetical protein
MRGATTVYSFAETRATGEVVCVWRASVDEASRRMDHTACDQLRASMHVDAGLPLRAMLAAPPFASEHMGAPCAHTLHSAMSAPPEGAIAGEAAIDEEKLNHDLDRLEARGLIERLVDGHIVRTETGDLLAPAR